MHMADLLVMGKIPPMDREVESAARALEFWTDRLGLTVEELLEFLAENKTSLDDLWATLAR